MGTESAASADYASAAEIQAAIEGLSEADAERLSRYANWRARALRAVGLAVDGNDLLQDAMARAVRGGTRWPRGISFGVYMLQLVKNVAGHHDRRGHAAPASLHEPGSLDPASDAPDPGRVAVARRLVAQVRARFSEDALASLIIDGWETEMTGPEIKEALGISQKEFETATRIRRGARSLED